ncbi:MAG: DNA adenine methylase [Planctomycetaceae bacterium]|nr:DNA adenine methylase [Planctomycetaceae bacterium]
MTTTKTKRRTLLPWMGGKSKLAAAIIERLPEHTTYVEPFCGGCAVFLRKPRSKVEILNDADDRLITLLRVFRFHSDELLREVQYLTHSRQEFVDALKQPGVTDIQKAARFLFIVKAAFGSRLSSPTFGTATKEPANFHIADVTTLVALARERLERGHHRKPRFRRSGSTI